MKELLVDTHILLWWLANDTRLSQNIMALIGDPENVIYVSAASIWEAAIKRKLGKLSFEDAALFEVLLNGDWQVLSMTIQHALIAANLPPHHHDPFDRMLIAQALHEDLTLITHDKMLKFYEVPIIWVE